VPLITMINVPKRPFSIAGDAISYKPGVSSGRTTAEAQRGGEDYFRRITFGAVGDLAGAAVTLDRRAGETFQ
jgi:hypothetical protein